MSWSFLVKTSVIYRITINKNMTFYLERSMTVIEPGRDGMDNIRVGTISKRFRILYLLLTLGRKKVRERLIILLMEPHRLEPLKFTKFVFNLEISLGFLFCSIFVLSRSIPEENFCRTLLPSTLPL